MSKISTWSTTAANNNSAVPDGWAESMLPSGVNNSAREMMAQIRDVWNDKEWFLLGDGDGTTTFTYASATSVTIASDITSTYHVGRRIKVVGSNTGTIYGKIATSSYSSPNTTLAFTFDSGSISASDSTVDVYAGSTYVAPSIPVIHDTSLGTSQILPPSQGAVKTYVDAQVTAQDLDISDGSTAIAIDIDSETLGLLGGTGIDSTASGNNVTMAIDSTVVTKTGTQTLTNKTLTSPAINNGVLSTPDLNGTELILDADQDTSITADTDDQVDIKIGGSDKISATSSALTIGDNSSDYNTTMRGMLTINPVTSSGVVTALNLPQGDSLQFGSGNTLLYKDRTSGVNYFRGDNTISIKSDGVNIGNASLTSDRATIQSSFAGNTGDVQINHANVTTGTSNRLLTHSTGLNLYGAIQFKDTSNSNIASIDTSGNITATNIGTISSQASNNVAITGGSITGMSSPSSNSDVAIKSYVDDAVAGLRTRIIAECATTANVNLTNGLEAGDTIDGVTLVAGDRVLVKDQSDATENGLYLAVSSGAASRDPEHDTIAELSGGMVVVNQGTANDNKIFLCTTDSDGSIGSTNITYTVITPSNTGTVTSVGLTQSGTEFTIGSTPITSSGNITINVNRIAATKIGANTNVSDTEYGYLANVSSDIQTQLDAKPSAGFCIALSIAL